MDKKWNGSWIKEARFAELLPLNLYHKEGDAAPPHHHDEELKNFHMLVRKEFVLTDAYKEALLDITADDYYKLYINGRFVGQGPAQGNYYYYYYNRYDVASFLKEGTNVIAVHVYYQGLVCRAYNSGDYRQGMIAELEVDGKLIVKSDQTWLSRKANEYISGGIVGYNTQYLEWIDSREQVPDWRNASIDLSGWKSCEEMEDHGYSLFLQPTPPVSVYEIKPQHISALPEGGYFIDFGHELTGQLRLKAQGREGDVVEIRYGEELNSDGRTRYEMRCNCVYRELWTLSGSMDEAEFFDYKAFRYVEVLATSSTVKIDIDSFRAVVRHYPLDEEASLFESSDSNLNAIWSICRNGVKFGSQEHYVDCPTREKGQYLGDNTIITHAHSYVSGDLRLFRKALQDFARLSDSVCPGLMAVAPGHFMQEIADFSFQWPLQLMQYYRQSGDIQFLKEMLPTAVNMLEHFRLYRREDGLLENVSDKWNLVDWPEGMRDGYDFPLTKPVGTGCHNVINAFYYGAMKVVSEMRCMVNAQHTDDEGDSYDLDGFRDSFRKAFFDESSQLFTDAVGSSHSALHSNVLPLLFGLVPEEGKESVIELIRTKRLNCGVYMSYFVLQALAEAGEYALIYDLISSDDIHSWNNMVKEGATTCFEAWSKEAKWNTSLCHAWASAPIPILIEHIAGIQPAEPGWKKVTFKPRIPDTLKELKLSFRVAIGTISYEHKNGQSTLRVPDGITIN
ncbi:Bacterial alpha-L-rhamnosidase [Paenibacillus sp. LMG 31460]|uniref:alpha-L-rhamnosidase n=1 Tax=Paenibacillus germinis TaxID=2654979 RepID=A0ABX1ZGZ3_9BACL|nr:family 78 glycoside hydrolase catalytic domain [Paenibacillus germinis]NOU91253.1 Bacterial alpha-L-rhamnosidase [Paenibacillus germinis]